MIELGDTPISVNVSPCNVAPREFSTNSDGTISGLAAAVGVPIVFMDAGAGAVCAKAAPALLSIAMTASNPAV